MNWKKARTIEFIVFLIGWTSIMLAGADYPPPAGFLWLVLLIIILDIIQDRYLRWLGEKLLGRKTFLLNELLFCIAGIVVAVGMILCNGGFRKETGVWVGIITAVSVIYGTAFWGINRIVADVIGKRRQ